MVQTIERDFKKIFARRDRRYDGRFYVGVKTTGIYCRPVCPAQPKSDNLLLFKSPSEAENAGYRACLRCHPDSAPGNKTAEGTATTVSRALRLINDPANAEWNVGQLAGSLGMTDRHLRRLFEEHLGASPIDVMITQRLHFAKQTLQQTAQPITDVAYAAGFQSIRRFNEAFAARFKRAPSSFRNTPIAVPDVLSLKIFVRPPYDWNTVLVYLNKHETHGVDRVVNGEYRRFMPIKKSFGVIAVSKPPKLDFLNVRFTDVPLIEARPILWKLKSLFDTDHNPAHLPSTKILSPNGIRVPGSFDPFETAVSIILGQLVSTEHAKAVVKKLVQRFGRKIGSHEGDDVYEFPSPTVLSTARVETIGVPRVRAGAVRALARAVRDGEIDFRSQAEFSVVTKRLLDIKGIGPWTEAMIAMRCLGDPDAFPELDLIVQRALERKLVDHAEWSSSRAYLTHCLWRDFGKTLSNKKEKIMNYVHQKIDSPVGPLHLVADDTALRVVTFEKMWPLFKDRYGALEEKETPLLKQTKQQLADYFDGKRRAFDLPLKLTGTPFQNRAWSALADIPFGETVSYKQQAIAIKSPAATRAVGRTNGLNPICIVLPCHRVIGSDGRLTGFGGGLKAKSFLLNFERNA